MDGDDGAARLEGIEVVGHNERMLHFLEGLHPQLAFLADRRDTLMIATAALLR